MYEGGVINAMAGMILLVVLLLCGFAGGTMLQIAMRCSGAGLDGRAAVDLICIAAGLLGLTAYPSGGANTGKKSMWFLACGTVAGLWFTDEVVHDGALTVAGGFTMAEEMLANVIQQAFSLASW